jgi:twitching motility protein PilI
MENTGKTDPVALLRDIEERCRICAGGLPHKQETGAEWSGIAFRVGSHRLVSPLGEVIEILDFPALTAVPMTRPWVRGIANIRGGLLPVIDLGGYLNGRRTKVTDKTRVLVVDCDDTLTGLVVDEVPGMKHFMNEEYDDGQDVAEEFLRPYLRGGFQKGEQFWGLFSLHALAESPQFLQAAV